jgi:hypothetical protein
MRTLFMFLLIPVCLVACATAQSQEAFTLSFDKYNQLVRWGDFDRAMIFSSSSISEEFGERVKAARDARITDYQIIDVRYDEKKLEASAVVTFSYYLSTSGQVARVTDKQKWAYIDEDGVKAWRLKSLLPEFR